MKALVKTAVGEGNVALLEAPVPKYGPQGVLIKVAAAGVCGTDVLILHDKVDIYRPPVILGHNVAGTVAAVGSDVRSLTVGDRVAIDMNVGACGHCAYCQSKREYLCKDRKGLGYGIDGGMAEYLAVDEEWAVKVPEGVDLTEAAAVDACNAIHTVVDRSPIGPGKSVLILGPGFQGLMMLQVAKSLGAGPLILVGGVRHEERFPLAEKLGADYTVASDREDLAAFVADLTGGEGVDVVLETTGSASALTEGLAVVRRGGCITMLGSLPYQMDIDMHHVVFDEISMNGVRGYTR
ncbi:MAG: zinc-dependent alcohol dehydrogenase, partial [Chloroflexota bacterium]